MFLITLPESETPSRRYAAEAATSLTQGVTSKTRHESRRPRAEVIAVSAKPDAECIGPLAKRDHACLRGRLQNIDDTIRFMSDTFPRSSETLPTVDE